MNSSRSAGRESWNPVTGAAVFGTQRSPDSDTASSISRQPRPVQMIPLRRCGSHAVRLRLNQNPEFYSPYPLHIVDFMPMIDLYDDLSSDDNYFQLILDLIGLQNAMMVKWDQVTLDPVSILEALADKPRSVHAVVWEMYFQAGLQRDASVVMDKSLDSVQYWREQLEVCPDLKFLNLVRDPRAQVNSMNRAIIHDFDSVLNALTWKDAHDQAQALIARHPERVLTVRYEDFIIEPEPVLRQICEFFRIGYTNAMLDITTLDEAHEIARRSALWESNDKPLMKEFIAKYTKQLTFDELEIIETITSEHMTRYGYDQVTPARTSATSAVIEAARARSGPARDAAWQSLFSRDPRDYQLRRYRAWYLDSIRQRFEQRPLPAASTETIMSGQTSDRIT